MVVHFYGAVFGPRLNHRLGNIADRVQVGDHALTMEWRQHQSSLMQMGGPVQGQHRLRAGDGSEYLSVYDASLMRIRRPCEHRLDVLGLADEDPAAHAREPQREGIAIVGLTGLEQLNGPAQILPGLHEARRSWAGRQSSDRHPYPFDKPQTPVTPPPREPKSVTTRIAYGGQRKQDRVTRKAFSGPLRSSRADLRPVHRKGSISPILTKAKALLERLSCVPLASKLCSQLSPACTHPDPTGLAADFRFGLEAGGHPRTGVGVSGVGRPAVR